jgi:hypothetical protein
MLVLAIFLHRVTHVVDAMARLVRSCTGLVGAITALILAIAALCKIAGAFKPVPRSARTPMTW